MLKIWRETVVIPTYETGKPEKNPIFLEKRVYQGSSGVVYPYPVIESIANEKSDKEYHVVFLENDYIKVMVMPELGGRIQMAYDKIKQRHFIYYNHVIKPALVGLAGPWISGGIEFNWPQHHRPSTFMPVDCSLEEGEDYVTCWVNERERMFHQQGQAGFTLRDGCAYLEIQGRVYNPTETPQTFLWWANPAVAVNDAYQSVFPPDVNAVFDHGKRAVSSFPIATGTYYKMDYSAGVDISNYKNIPVPTSYMVAKSKYNFEGGYENDTQAGMLHVADHHVSPGKKQWTWGNGDFGRAWDRALTDEDGPYIELMAGVYTENQPDFTWLMPYEEKTFTQYFMPYRELGIVKNANKDFIINVTPCGDDEVRLQVFATSKKQVAIELRCGKNTLSMDNVTLSPETIYDKVVSMNGAKFQNLILEVSENDSSLFNHHSSLTWRPEPDEITPIPDAAEAALKPEDIKTNEQLYLTGLHLEQYRHATWSALDYYNEALRRDPLDVRCNNAMGLWYLRRGRFRKAEPYLRTAVKVLQRRNPNPYDGEPLYNLALCLKYQAVAGRTLKGNNYDCDKLDEAYDWAYKSTWNAAWQQAGHMMCAQIASMRGDYIDALHHVEKSLLSGWHNHKARALKVSLMKKLRRKDETFVDYSLQINPFNYGILYELGRKDEMRQLMRQDANNYDELALDYVAAGLYDEALDVWRMAEEEGAATAMTHYYIAWLTDSNNSSVTSLDYCFPNRMEAVCALSAFPEDGAACYLLGCLFYDKRQYIDAAMCWRACAERMPDFPTVHRNLALYYYNVAYDETRALSEMERAYTLDEEDSRVLMELDQLYKRIGRPARERLRLLEAHPRQVEQRDDLMLEMATLRNQLGEYKEARRIIDERKFHVWEGGEGKVSGQYQFCRIEMAKRLLKNPNVTDSDVGQAITLLTECLSFPENIGEGKLLNAQDNDFYYFLGKACQMRGDETTARTYFEKGTAGPTEPAAAMYYNDAKADKIFYAAMCYRELGIEQMARSLFNKLISYGEKHLFDNITMDYFAVSLPDLLVWRGDLTESNRIHCNYMLALGHYGIGNTTKAEQYLRDVISMDINHLGALSLKTYISS